MSSTAAHWRRTSPQLTSPALTECLQKIFESLSMRQGSAATVRDLASDGPGVADSPARLRSSGRQRNVSVIRVRMVPGKAAMTMYPPERQRAITDLLIQHHGRRASVLQISEQLRVTTETVRRDLDVLERRGVLRRIRGGAELLDSTPFEQALAARHAEQFEDKLVIARRVVDELPEDGVVVLDSGSLTLVCAQAMPKDRALAVVTNNLPAAQYLADCDNLRIFTLPGTIRGLTSAAVDAWTGRRLSTLTVDLAIIGVNGITPTHGLTTTNPEEAATKRAMLLSARRRVARETARSQACH